jgi:hypothetical protein
VFEVSGSLVALFSAMQYSWSKPSSTPDEK